MKTESFKAWVARDEDGALWIYLTEVPEKGHLCWNTDEWQTFEIDRNLLPEVKWEDEKPTEVEVTIKPKEQ